MYFVVTFIELQTTSVIFTAYSSCASTNSSSYMVHSYHKSICRIIWQISRVGRQINTF